MGRLPIDEGWITKMSTECSGGRSLFHRLVFLSIGALFIAQLAVFVAHRADYPLVAVFLSFVVSLAAAPYWLISSPEPRRLRATARASAKRRRATRFLYSHARYGYAADLG